MCSLDLNFFVLPNLGDWITLGNILCFKVQDINRLYDMAMDGGRVVVQAYFAHIMKP